MHFVPKNLVEAIAKEQPSGYNCVQNKVKRKASLRYSDIREAHASFLTKYLAQPEIDFIHGRVSANVFMGSYFNPALIGDLKERVFLAVGKIEELCG